MKRVRMTTGGRVSIPAAIRRRWGTTTLAVDDRGDHLIFRPVPDDAISAARGVPDGRLPHSAAELTDILRAEEAEIERLKWPRS